MQKTMSHFVNPDNVAGEVTEFSFHLTLVILSRPPHVVSVLSHFTPLERYVVELDRVELSFPWASLIVISSADYRW